MKIYFICYPHGPANKSGYEHQIISIAEGLKKLNVDFSGNVNYWRNSLKNDDFLIRAEEKINFENVDVVVFSAALFYYNRLDLLPKNLLSAKHNFKIVFIDSSDGLITPGFYKKLRNIDFILKSHYCNKHHFPKNFIPWQYGLTNRIIDSVKPLPFEQRADEIQINFRVKHQSRKLIDKSVMNIFYEFYRPNYTVDSHNEIDFDGINELYWRQTGRRHYPSYYSRLGRSKLCSAFGGYLQKSNFANNKRIFSPFIYRIENRLNPKPFDRIYQFDSWRLWESLASGCCTLHLDFKKYGMSLPVMPENMTHYFGVDLDKINQIKEISRNKEMIANIGNNGREWVLKNYCPQKIAERFLNLVQ
jgi:hypothetical protein